MSSSPPTPPRSTDRRRLLRPVPPRRLFYFTVVFNIPTALVLGVMTAYEMLDWSAALLAVIAIGILLSAILHVLIADLSATAVYLRTSTGEDTANVVTPDIHHSETAREIAQAAQGLRQRAMRRVMRAEVMANFQAAILDTLPEPLLLIGEDRQITRSNAAARRIFGAGLQGRPLVSILRDPDFLDQVEAAFAEDPDRRTRPPGESRVTFSLAGPVERTFEATIDPLPAERLQEAELDGPRVLVLLHDVTSLVRVEQMRADFVANASHELRTPLATVLGFVETLRGPARDDEEARDRFLSIMHQQALRMKQLIEDLLSLSRIELREHTPPTGRVDVARVVVGVVEGLEFQAGEKEMTLAVSLPPTLPPAIGDADELAQVFQNLISNAIKYGRTGTTVTITAAPVRRGPVAMPQATRDNCLEIRVHDQGEGIAPEHLPRLTERFYRVDTARSRQMGGTGLGLAIVKHILNRHQGALTIASTVGEGSTFAVFLPLG